MRGGKSRDTVGGLLQQAMGDEILSKENVR